MISIPSTPRVLHPTLGSNNNNTTSTTSNVSSSSSATTTTTTTIISAADDRHSSSSSSPHLTMHRSQSTSHASLAEMLPLSDATTPSSAGAGPISASVECKRPKHYHVHSHSSRHVNLTDEITPRDMALSIIQAQYHIYHTDLSGYLAGGAMVQDALTKYALGGAPKDLYQTYKRFRQDKERIPPAPTITITTRNWRDWLGHKSYYHDYLDFFDHELQELETRTLKESSTSSSPSGSSSPSSSTPPEPLSTSWSASHPTSPFAESMAKMVSEYLTPLIPGLCASTGPLIHLGYAVEFGSRLATAEGLAYACISYQPATTCFIPSSSSSASGATGSWTSSTVSSESSRKRPSPTVAILNMMRNDKRLDGMFDAGFQAKLNVVMSSRVSLLKSYLGMWTSQVHSVSEALLDLSQTSSLLLFTATNRFGDEEQLDKNLANILLATHAARFLVRVLPTEVEKGMLLKAIWMSLVATFVVQGRPKLTAARMITTLPVMADVCPEDKEQYSREQEQEQDQDGSDGTRVRRTGMVINAGEAEVPKIPTGRWRSLSLEAIHADHQIVPKIVRSLWWAEVEHGECGDLFYEAAVRAVGEDPASDESTGPGF